tara:strand:+ start:50 stop:1081 length:1032 start_codon:yes stop_codon:yes gene_type:complete
MKKSDIRRIIKEEVINVIRGQNINEAFGDPLLAKLDKMGLTNTKWKSFWRSAAKTYDIAWDKLPKGSVRKVQPTSPEVKKGMAFYVINQDKENPFATSSYSYDNTLRGPGVLAVTIDGKIQYYQNNTSGGLDHARGIAGKKAASSYRGAPNPVGKGVRGTMMVKKLQQLADDVYVFDLESYRGGTKALKGKRAELKLGKDKFKDATAWKRANLARYKEIINSRVSTRDAVDAMVAKIVKASNEAVEAAMGLPKQNRSGQLLATVAGKEVPLHNVTNAMTKALQLYSEYISNENDAEREATQGSGRDGRVASTNRYYIQRKREKAGDIKQLVNKFKTGKLDGWY